MNLLLKIFKKILGVGYWLIVKMCVLAFVIIMLLLIISFGFQLGYAAGYQEALDIILKSS